MIKAFAKANGGLFQSVEKADVGSSYQELEKQGIALMGWADPFMPDYSLPSFIEDALIEAIKDKSSPHYTAPIGNEQLKYAIAKKLEEQNHLKVDPLRNILITPGSDSGLFFATLPFIEADDEVIIFSPSYPNNYLNVEIMHGIIKEVILKEEIGYQIDEDDLNKAINAKTKAIILTHPNNPTTTVFDRNSLEIIRKACIKHDLVLICDQAFEDHIFDGIEFVCPCTLPGMWERTVTICSLSKGYGLSGFRIAYLYTNEEIMDKYYGACVNIVGAPCTISTMGAIAALQDETILPEYYQRLDRRRTIAYDILSTIPGVKMKKSESGILSWLDVSQLGTGQEVADYIKENANVLVNDGAAYGQMGQGHIRIVTACFAKDEDCIIRLERIKKALTQLAKEKEIV